MLLFPFIPFFLKAIFRKAIHKCEKQSETGIPPASFPESM